MALAAPFVIRHGVAVWYPSGIGFTLMSGYLHGKFYLGLFKLLGASAGNPSACKTRCGDCTGRKRSWALFASFTPRGRARREACERNPRARGVPAKESVRNVPAHDTRAEAGTASGRRRSSAPDADRATRGASGRGL